MPLHMASFAQRSRLTIIVVSLTLGLAPIAAPAAAATKVACIGDSITHGAGATGPNKYPSWLGHLLGGAYQVGNFGVSGSTMMMGPGASYWKTTTFADSKAFAPNIVVIMLGTNDSKPYN